MIPASARAHRWRPAEWNKAFLPIRARATFDDGFPLAVAKAKTAWRNAVNAIKDGGGTNLTAGWMLGRDELAKAPEGFNRRLLLLTDGQLNVGIVDPVQVQGIG